MELQLQDRGELKCRLLPFGQALWVLEGGGPLGPSRMLRPSFRGSPPLPFLGRARLPFGAALAFCTAALHDWRRSSSSSSVVHWTMWKVSVQRMCHLFDYRIVHPTRPVRAHKVDGLPSLNADLLEEGVEDLASMAVM